MNLILLCNVYTFLLHLLKLQQKNFAKLTTKINIESKRIYRITKTVFHKLATLCLYSEGKILKLDVRYKSFINKDKKSFVSLS